MKNNTDTISELKKLLNQIISSHKFIVRDIEIGLGGYAVDKINYIDEILKNFIDKN